MGLFQRKGALGGPRGTAKRWGRAQSFWAVLGVRTSSSVPLRSA